MKAEWGVVKNGIAPLYGHPDSKTPRKDEMLCGMEAEIWEQAGVWCYVRTAYGYEGYMRTEEFIHPGEIWVNAEKWQVRSSFADVLDRPQVQAVVLAELPRGARVAMREVGQSAGDREAADGLPLGWCAVRLPSGMCGYMQKSRLEPLPKGTRQAQTVLRKRLTECALSYLGVSYRWGGKTPMGIDCSGLVFMSYWLCGITIWRDAQIREGFLVRPIPIGRAKPGDLLYFPGHVAMLLDGERYIHATGKAGSDGVVVNTLSAGKEGYRADLRNNLRAVGSIF